VIALGPAISRLTRGFRLPTNSARRKLSAAEARDIARAFLHEVHDYLDHLPQVDDVIRMHGRRIYREMEKRDETVKMGLALKKATVLAPGYEIRPGDEGPEFERDADLVKAVFDEMEGSLDNVLLKGLDGYRDGFSVQEMNWRQLERGAFAGKFGLRNIKDKPSHTFDMKVDAYGNLLGMRQTQFWGSHDAPVLPLAKFFRWTYDGASDNPYGTSDLRAAFPHYQRKEIILRAWTVFLERFAMPALLGEAGDDATQSERTSLLAFLRDFQGAGAAILPEGLDIEMLESARSGKAEYEGAGKFANKGIMRALLLPSLIADEGESGSYSLGGTHLNIFLWGRRHDQGILAESFDEQVVRTIVQVNHGPRPVYPSLTFNNYTTEDETEAKRLVLEGISTGALDSREPWIRERMDWEEEPEEIRQLREQEEKERQEARTQVPVDGRRDAARGKDPEPARREFAALETYAELPETLRKVDWNGMGQDLARIENEALVRTSTLMRSTRDTFVRSTLSSRMWARRDQGAVDALKLPNRQPLTNALSSVFGEAVLIGLPHARREVEKGIGEKLDLSRSMGTNFREGDPVPIPGPIRPLIRDFDRKVPIPRQLLGDYHRKAFTITGITEDRILASAKAIVTNAMMRGTSQRIVEGELLELFEPYVGLGTADKALAYRDRLATIIRTNVIEAFSTGRMNFFRDETVWAVLEAFQYSSILDDRTTDICRTLHGVIFRKGDPRVALYTAPNHYNCRGNMVPITFRELFTLTPDEVLQRLLDPAKGFRV